MKPTTIVIIIVAALIGGMLLLSKNNSKVEEITPANNVRVINGQQIIEINAKGGYSPRLSLAKAGLPTILRVNTNSTFDCSSSLRVPSFNFSKILPSSGVTNIDLGNPVASTLQGFCGMGMYSFEVEFR